MVEKIGFEKDVVLNGDDYLGEKVDEKEVIAEKRS